MLHIYRTGVADFGADQAERYQDGLEQTFAFLAEFPFVARERTELAHNVRAHAYRSHLVFYRVTDRDVFVLRIRHAREDWLSQPDAL